MLRQTEHLLLLCWALVLGLVVFGVVVTLDTGLMRDFIVEDRSRICVVIVAMYLIGVVHSYGRTAYLSRELNLARAAETRLAAHQAGELRLDAGTIRLPDGSALPNGFVSDYIADYARTRAQAPDPQNDSGGDLLEAYASRLRGKHEFGWFWIDLMLKVGFLGTLVGFIMMLASVSQNTVIDASTMQNVLKQMSFGMSTALNTTLASLVAGTLLSFPYYLLGRGLDELIECTIRIAQVDVLPRLAPTDAHARS